jgi:hypothetical protein
MSKRDISVFTDMLDPASPRLVPLITGTATADNVEELMSAAGGACDSFIGVKVRFDPAPADDDLQYSVSGDTEDDYLIVFRSGDPTSTELVINGAFRWEQGAYVVDGFFLVKSGGMHQGVVSLGLQPVEEAILQSSPKIAILEQPLL